MALFSLFTMCVGCEPVPQRVWGHWKTVSGFSLVFYVFEGVPWHCCVCQATWCVCFCVSSCVHVCRVCSSFESGDSNSDPHALRASPSPTEPSPQSLALFLMTPIWHYIMFLPNVNTSSFHFQIFCLISLLMPSILPAVFLMSCLFFLVPSTQSFSLCFSERPFVGVFKPPSCLLTAFYIPLNPYIVFLSFKFL